MTYDDFFKQAYGARSDSQLSPFHYQRRLALSTFDEQSWPDLLDIPTGLGKTAAIVLAWLYKRLVLNDPKTPRRLVYCLPMRVLVEQTQLQCQKWLQNLMQTTSNAANVRVTVLMGGSEDMRTPAWMERPEDEQILIGTQDMLLSGALMRGYGVNRYLWPMEFALLHNDALWVFDEVQLMGAGLTTSAQLEAFRRTFPLPHRSRSLWASATLRSTWLETVDMKSYTGHLKSLTLSDEDRIQAGARLKARKTAEQAAFSLTADASGKKGEVAYLTSLCDLVLQAHEPDAQTLVIVNRVSRAQRLFRLIQERRPNEADLLIHARFRAAERLEQARRLRESPGGDRIIIATQAIEAGVDITSKLLVTELAPWPSLVQRFGRCNRYGEHNANGGSRVIWVDIDDAADVLPYDTEQLKAARAKLVPLTSVSPGDLPRIVEGRPIAATLRRKDLLDLFNTDPDLSGFDVDVSDYIRDSSPPGVQVFWREFDDDPNSPEPQGAPARAELCPVSVEQARGLNRREIWTWDNLSAQWVKLDRAPRPGLVLLLSASAGGYDDKLGFDAGLKKAVLPVAVSLQGGPPDVTFAEDWRSRQAIPVALSEHLANVAGHARDLCNALGQTAYSDAVIRAGRWHDVGKSHPIFDATMHRCAAAPSGLLAKSPCRGTHTRQFFRHELASMLAWLEQHGQGPKADLIAYLIVAHHGKVRMSLRALPTERADPAVERFARGIWEGDTLPALEFDGERSQETVLRLALMELGESDQGPSWTARCLRLLDEHGPFQLAWLETLVRLADWRASKAEQTSKERGK